MEMNYLNRLTPAEILFFTQGKDAEFKDLARYTFLHLVLRGVLTIKTKTKVNKRGQQRTYKYVIPGPQFDSYKVEPHERAFLFVYVNERFKEGLLVRYFIRKFYEETGTLSSFFWLLRRSSNVKEILGGFFRIPLFYYFTIKKRTTEATAKINKELEDQTETFKHLLENDPQKAFEMMLTVGANVFFLHPLSSALDELFEHQYKVFRESNSTDFYDFDTSGWDSVFSNMGDSFSSDASWSSDSWDYSSACSSDGGCSHGCSGCSGCGSGD